MLAERLLSTMVRTLNAEYMRLEPATTDHLPAPMPGKGYMLYAHVPFCERLCPYCSFNRFPFSEKRAVPYFEHLRKEMRMLHEMGYDFESLYVGGGTPTVMVDELCETLDLARELFSIKEISSETNPNHLIPEIVDKIAPRVQRLSVGVQSFDDRLLKQMDRYDKYGSSAEIFERIQWAADKFHSLNVDMIFNFPSQTPEILRNDVEMLKACGANQTTFYPLMASPAVAASLKRTVGEVDYAREADYYKIISRGLSDTFTPGSAWTFSRTGGGMIDEYIVDYEEYAGIGSGAFSYLDGALYSNTFSLGEYSERLEAGKMSVVNERVFNEYGRMRYRFMMQLFGLRLDKREWERDFGRPVESGLPFEMLFMKNVGAFETNTDEEITLTEKGRYLLVAMMREFFIGVNNVRDQARSALRGPERELIFGDGPGCGDGGGCGPDASE